MRVDSIGQLELKLHYMGYIINKKVYIILI
jgi:hypothetical protein